MPGMGPPPPGTYMPSPYMHPMHYPHTMPPPNGESIAYKLPRHSSCSRFPAMYPSPSMGQMPRESFRNRHNYASDLAISSWTVHGPSTAPWYIPTATQRRWTPTIHAANPNPCARPSILFPEPTTCVTSIDPVACFTNSCFSPVQHAVPYPMMMPPGQHVPHPYEGAPPAPVQMGGVGHA